MPHKLLQISQSVRAILPDVERVDLVPGIAHRRAVFLQAARATTTLRSWRSVGNETPPMLQLRLAIHDCVAIAQVATVPRSEHELFKRDAELLEDNGDVFLTAAAVGDTEFIELHFARFFHSPGDERKRNVFRRMRLLSREQGFEALVSWLDSQQAFDVAEPNETMEQVDTISADLTQLQFSPTPTAPSSPEHSLTNTSTVAAVFTNLSLMERIGSYQHDPRLFVDEYKARVVGDAAKTDCLPGVLVHYAVIHGDLHALQMLYTARILYPDVAVKPEVSFSLAMHLAACEGRLDLVQWLHTRCQRHPTHFTCCPDTLAMAVRCGWAEIVEWLHLNVPESERTMSEYAVNDAAYWGHVDVLRMCHKYQLGELTDRTMACAARAGQLEAVKLLRSLEGLALNTREAMDEAIERGHVAIVEYFLQVCSEPIDERRLSISLRSSTASSDAMVQFLWTHADQDIEARERAARENFADLCGKWSIQTVEMVLPFVTQDTPTLLIGLDRAVQTIRPPIVRLLLPLCVQSSSTVHDELLEMLEVALMLDNNMIASMLLEAGKFSPDDLGATFRDVVLQPPRHDHSILVDLHLHEFCEDAFVVVAEAGDVALLERLHGNRTKTTAIEALRAAKNAETAQFLLVNESEFYTERIVLENAPPCIEPKLMRMLLQRGHQADLDAAVNFGDVQYLSNRLLDPDEVKMIQEAEDPVLTARLVARHANLLPPTFVSTSIDNGSLDLVDYIHNELALAELTIHELSNRIENGQLDDVQVMLDVGVRDIPTDTLMKILRTNHMNVVQFLFDQHDEGIDARFMSVLADALHQSREEEESHCGGVRSASDDQFGWTLSLLQLFVQQRPALHCRLLEMVARAGSMAAVSYMLSPRSGVDTAKLALVPCIIAAARGGHQDVVEVLLLAKREDEVVSVAGLREQLSSVSDAGALQVLLLVLSRVDPSVKAELDKEREAASVLFGCGPASSGISPASSTHKRKATGRARLGRRW